MKLEMKNVFILIFLLLPLLFSCSNYGAIEGKVIDKITGQPIKGAAITIKGTTIKSSTDKEGSFKLTDVVPGIQKISVEKDGFISFSEIELTIAKRTTSKCSDLFLIQKPKNIGLHLVGKSLKSINLIKEKNVNENIDGDYIIRASIIHNPEKLDSIKFILFEGDNIQKPSEIQVYSMKFFPFRSNSFWGDSPERWVSQERVRGLKIEPITSSLALITGKLPTGRYCIRVEHEYGVQDWFFVFDSK